MKEGNGTYKIHESDRERGQTDDEMNQNALTSHQSALGYFAVGQFTVKKTKPNLTENNILFDSEVSQGEKSAHDINQ